MFKFKSCIQNKLQTVFDEIDANKAVESEREELGLPPLHHDGQNLDLLLKCSDFVLKMFDCELKMLNFADDEDAAEEQVFIIDRNNHEA